MIERMTYIVQAMGVKGYALHLKFCDHPAMWHACFVRHGCSPSTDDNFEHQYLSSAIEGAATRKPVDISELTDNKESEPSDDPIRDNLVLVVGFCAYVDEIARLLPSSVQLNVRDQLEAISKISRENMNSIDQSSFTGKDIPRP